MPTYDYECDACHHKFEKFQSILADPLKECPACGQPSARRLMGTGGGVVFKGSGFYQTDYRSESYKKSASADKPGDGGGSSAKGGSESAPAASKETPAAKSDGGKSDGGKST